MMLSHLNTTCWIAVEHLRLGVFSFLLHDVQDHAASGRAAFRGGVDADRLLSSTCVLFAMHVNPAANKKDQNLFIK